MRYVVIAALFLALAGLGGSSAPEASKASVVDLTVQAPLNP